MISLYVLHAVYVYKRTTDLKKQRCMYLYVAYKWNAVKETSFFVLKRNVESGGNKMYF